MIVRTATDPPRSNSYLVADRPGGRAVLIDAGAPPEPLLNEARRNALTVERLLLTHHHQDHVVERTTVRRELGVEVWAHPSEAQWLPDVDRTISPDRAMEIGGMRIEVLHIPGHTAGGLAFLINDRCVFTGDTLFRGSIGCLFYPGATTFADHQHSILSVLMRLPPATAVYPGHAERTTIGAEWEHNPFIRVWRGLDSEDGSRCTVQGREATVVVAARDYDGGRKVWLRWLDTGDDDVMPGSRVTLERGSAPTLDRDDAEACRLQPIQEP